MNEKDASVIKILTELGLREEKPLNEEEEYILKCALDADFRYAEEIKKLFSQPQSDEKK